MGKKVIKIVGIFVGSIFALGSVGGFIQGDYLLATIVFLVGSLIVFFCLPKAMKQRLLKTKSSNSVDSVITDNKNLSSGVFIPHNSGFKELLDSIPENSINAIAKHLGYSPEMFHTYFGEYNTEADIQAVIFEIFTSNIIFVSTKNSVKSLSAKQVKDYLKKYNVNNEFDSVTSQGILEDGIENESLKINYLQRVLELNDNTPNGILFSNRLGLYLHFNNGILTDFQSADGLNQWAKHWNELNPKFIESYEKEAVKYWGASNFQKITNEINVQSNAFADTPSSLENPFCEFHKTSFGNINFFNLLIAHHDSKVNLSEFLEINHGRFEELKSQNDLKRYKVGGFIYEFSSDNQIINTYAIN